MITVVTGSNGFIGSHLVEALLEQGFYVRCLDIAHDVKVKTTNSRIEYCTIDCSDVGTIKKSKVLDDAQYIFHLAGVTKRVTLEQFRIGNVLPTKNLLEVVVEKRIQLKRFVYISSQAAAGVANSLDRPLTELCKPEPIEAYGKSKLEAERIVQKYIDQIPCTILRPSAVYGPRDVDFLNIFKLVTNRLSIYPGCRDKFISIIFVKDLVNGIIQAARAPVSTGKNYFLSSEKPVRWRDIHGIIAKVADKTVVDINIPHWMVNFASRFGNIYSRLTGNYSLINSQKIALSKPHYWVCSSQQAKKDFDFETKFSLEEGMEKTYQWYIENDVIKPNYMKQLKFYTNEENC